MSGKAAKHTGLLVYIATILGSLLYLFAGNRLAGYRPAPSEGGQLTCTAVVTEITDVQTQTFTLSGDAGQVYTKDIFFRARLTSGNLKGITISALQQQDSMLAASPDDVTPGSRVILSYVDMGEGENVWCFMEYHRSGDLVWLCGLFLALLLLFGRKKGVSTIVSLVFTCLAIFWVFVPSILGGKNVYLWTVITCVYITVMTLLLVSGANRKSLCAAAGCLGGLAFTGVVTLIMDRIMHLSGLVDERSIYLTMLDGQPVNLRAIIFGAILVGAMGATMDVSMSLSSALHEVAGQMEENAGFSALLRSGFNIGRDMMCTMANTLILAYIGSSLSTVLLLVVSAESLLSLFNREMIVVEVLQAIVGSLGILFTIPATSLLAAFVYQTKPLSQKQQRLRARKAAMKASPVPEMGGKYDQLESLTRDFSRREQRREKNAAGEFRSGHSETDTAARSPGDDTPPENPGDSRN